MKPANQWQIELKADAGVFEKLSSEFHHPELCILKDADCWFLESTYLDSDESSDIYATGEKLIEYLNHALWLYAYRFNPIKSNGYHLLANTGQRTYKFFALGQVTAPTMLIVYSNDIPGWKSFDLFSRNWKVKESLALFHNPAVDWITLFKIYETVRDDEPDIRTSDIGIALIKNWCGEVDNDRFHETANWHRHSKFGKYRNKPITPPKNQMQLQEGRQFVRKLLIAWLEYKKKH